MNVSYFCVDRGFFFFLGPGFTLQAPAFKLKVMFRRLETGGEFRGGMLHCCSNMMSGGGEKSITFTFLVCGFKHNFGDED